MCKKVLKSHNIILNKAFKAEVKFTKLKNESKKKKSTD